LTGADKLVAYKDCLQSKPSLIQVVTT